MTESLSQWYRTNTMRPIRLHVGCGGVRWRDFVNVDLYPHREGTIDSSRDGCVADVFADMRNLGLPNNSVDEIFSSHTIEHFVQWEAIDMLRDWLRMLKPGGFITLETADFNRCLLLLLWPRRGRRQLALSQFYGNQWDRLDFETHRYLWSAREIKQRLLEIGYSSVSVSHKTWTHVPWRDMHIVARK